MLSQDQGLCQRFFLQVLAWGRNLGMCSGVDSVRPVLRSEAAVWFCVPGMRGDGSRHLLSDSGRPALGVSHLGPRVLRDLLAHKSLGAACRSKSPYSTDPCLILERVQRVSLALEEGTWGVPTTWHCVCRVVVPRASTQLPAWLKLLKMKRMLLGQGDT